MASSAVADTLRVFAAASLTNALDEVLEQCSADTGVHAVGVYAGSGTLARQIGQGAPADLYISANPQWMDWLATRDAIVEETRAVLLGNRLVLVANANLDDAIKSLDAASLPAFMSSQRVAVADTETVPAGMYARQALEARNWWHNDSFAAALVQAGSVREALSWVARGETGLGIVYQTDGIGEDRVKQILKFEASEHDPIQYPIAIVTNRETSYAKRLLACLKSEKAFATFESYGFVK